MDSLQAVDISESALNDFDHEAMENLLRDHTTGKNILWCTDDYSNFGDGFQATDQIIIDKITGEYGILIRPRALKSKAEQKYRTRDKAEVFTPSWICNAQNNLIDNAWFGRENVFNTENPDHTWTVNPEPVTFPEGKTWRDYVRDTRLEITCGEAPYLASRYDTTTGEMIDVANRIGLLDRKLRVIGENVHDHGEWLRWVRIAYQNIYGYEWQGDSLLIARETLLLTLFDYHVAKFPGRKLQKKSIRTIASIISWNLWQMDGLKGVIPNSCKSKKTEGFDIFGQHVVIIDPCPGCSNDDIRSHNGTHCLVKDWNAKKEKQIIRFVDLLK